MLALAAALAMTFTSCSDDRSDEKLLDVALYHFQIRVTPDVEYCLISSGPSLVGYSLVFKGNGCPKESPASQQEGVVNVYGEFNADYRFSSVAALETSCQNIAGGAPVSPLKIDTEGMSLSGCGIMYRNRTSYYFLIPRGSWKPEKDSVQSVPRIFIHMEFSIPKKSPANASQILDKAVKMIVLENDIHE
jgi:hypothetical protein